MRPLTPPQLLTCRYWAFGSLCPDHDSSNVQTCQFAHWDTGHLVSFDEQPGTCYEWFKSRVCALGSSCDYEHRDTGVMGLDRGMLVLDGLNLEVADAARTAGFNTRNHVALMDLIWAVRRVAFCYAVEAPHQGHPPPHPFYPDRYRPLEPRYNTWKPKKRARKPKKRRAPTESLANSVDSDTDDPRESGGTIAANSSAKRLKFVTGYMGQHKVKLPTRPKPQKQKYRSAKVDYETEDYASTCLPLCQPLDGLNAGATAEPVLDQPALPDSCPQVLAETQLSKVRDTLKDYVAAVLECGKAMKATYNADSRLANDIIYPELITLKNKFDDCSRDAEDGIQVIDKVIGLLVNEEVTEKEESLITFSP